MNRIAKYSPLKKSLHRGRAKTTLVHGNPGCLLYIATTLSGLLTVVESVCIVITTLSIIDLQNTKGTLNSPESRLNSSISSNLVGIPCNQSTPCQLLAGPDSGILLFKLMLGVWQQTLIRSTKSLNYYQQPLSVHYDLENCNRQSLSWKSSSYGQENESDGTVTIRENATYGLYNTFTFRSPTQTDDELMEIQHQIKIERRSDNCTSAVLLKKSFVLSPSPQAFVEHGFFEFVNLQEGDRVYPHLSDTSCVYKARHSSSWGLFKLT